MRLFLEEELTRVWREESLNRLEIVHARHSTHVFPRHMHETYAFFSVVTGTHALSLASGDEPVVAGDLIGLNPGRVTAVLPAESGHAYIGIYPTVEMIMAIAAEFPGSRGEPDFANPVIKDRVLARQLSNLIACIEGGADSLECEFLLGEWLVRLVSRHAATRRAVRLPGKENLAFSRARDYIHAKFADPIRLEEIAGIAGLSPFQLIRVFERELGMPPHAYCINLRVSHAKRLITDGVSIGEAAIHSGFADQSHLTRWFKRITGTTPGQFA